ncbi:hypothetical protein EX30DRAFT_344565 [Ascodesmis nigricans]|uniref:Uncharacterized protein n=1 Tax=Ascodesmis nigricans TaxID=341454 RepID=A0A4S2MJ87_9PEZI|nr:hypothetical protein EX30DRAFT_344565 [Ascodesmis nigricans]
MFACTSPLSSTSTVALALCPYPHPSEIPNLAPLKSTTTPPTTTTQRPFARPLHRPST